MVPSIIQTKETHMDMTDPIIRNLYPRSSSQPDCLDYRELGVLIEAHLGRKVPHVGPSVREKALAAGWIEPGHPWPYQLTAAGRALLPKSSWSRFKKNQIVYRPGSEVPIKVLSVFNDGYAMKIDVYGGCVHVIWFHTDGREPYETRKGSAVSSKTRRNNVVVTINGVESELSWVDAEKLRMDIATSLNTIADRRLNNLLGIGK
jgi:hypothetical protein